MLPTYCQGRIVEHVNVTKHLIDLAIRKNGPKWVPCPLTLKVSRVKTSVDSSMGLYYPIRHWGWSQSIYNPLRQHEKSYQPAPRVPLRLREPPLSLPDHGIMLMTYWYKYWRYFMGYDSMTYFYILDQLHVQSIKCFGTWSSWIWRCSICSIYVVFSTISIHVYTPFLVYKSYKPFTYHHLHTYT